VIGYAGRMSRTHVRMSLIAMVGVAPLGGCVFDNIRDIRDDLQTTNQRLDRTEQLLVQVGEVNPKLVELQGQLDDTRARLETIKSIDHSLVEMNATLKSVDKSLASLDTHLASLRKTLENIDSTIPFLKFADEEEEPGPDEQIAAPESEDAAGSPAAEGEPERPPVPKETPKP